MRYLLFFLLSSNAFAFTLNTNINAAFSSNKVKIYVSENSSCTNAGVSKEELLSIAVEGGQKFWNRVPSSNLELSRGGIYSTSDSKFLTGVLCVEDSVTSCNPSTTIPAVTEIVIACNSNTTDNFTFSGMYALTLPNNISNKSIKGAVILVNDSASTPFSSLSREEMINVMAHEIGHAIGIGHSKKAANLMYSTYYPNRHSLGQDDIDAVTYLYPNKLDGCSGIFGTVALLGDDDQSPPFLWTLIIGLSIGIFMISLVKNITVLVFSHRRSKTNPL
jgi:hypothetical protein